MDVPVAQEAAVHRAFDAMRDVADGLTLDAAQLERERRVVVEEWRLRLGLAQRQRQPLEAAWFAGSPYADRPVLGDIDRLAVMPIENVRRFYRDHYHPDQMALVVAGGLPLATLESLVHESFDTLRASPSPGRLVPDSPRHDGTRYAAFTDAQVRAATVGVMFVLPHPPQRTSEDLREMLVRILAGAVMNQRLAIVARGPAAPFRAASARLTSILANTDVVSFSALVGDGNASAALSGVLQEIARAREHGFTDAELAPAKAAAAVTFLRPPRTNREIVDGLASHFIRGEPAPGPTQLAVAAQTILLRLTNDDIRDGIRTAWSDTNRVVTSSVPENAAVAPVTEAVLRQAVATADRAPVPQPWQPVIALASTDATLPSPGKVQSRREDEHTGITVLTLSNGVEVWLKPLPIVPGAAPSAVLAATVSFAAWAPGGAALTSAAARSDAQLSAQLVAGAGVGGLTPSQRAQLLQGKPVTVQPYVTFNAHGMNGAARSRDLDAALNLVHLYFTAPNEDDAAFARVKADAVARVQTRATDPAAAFQSRLSAINSNGFEGLRWQTTDEIVKVDPRSALRFYREQFSNAADFTFFFAGPFSMDTIAPLLEKYVGSLPSRGAARDVTAADAAAPSFPATVVRETVRKGRDPRSQVQLTFFNARDGDTAREERAAAVASILQARVFNRLRGVMGATYAVNTNAPNLSASYGTITVSFVCAPANVKVLTDAALEEAERLARDGPTLDEVAAARVRRQDELKTRLVQPSYWIDQMERARHEHRPAASIPFDPAAIIASLTLDGLKDAARANLPNGRYTVVALLPEVQ
jgi:zinc protease